MPLVKPKYQHHDFWDTLVSFVEAPYAAFESAVRTVGGVVEHGQDVVGNVAMRVDSTVEHLGDRVADVPQTLSYLPYVLVGGAVLLLVTSSGQRGIGVLTRAMR